MNTSRSARHGPSFPELLLIILISLGAILSGCTRDGESRRTASTATPTANPIGNGVEAITKVPHDEIKKKLQEYFRNHGMQVRSSDGNTIKTEPTTLTSSNQLTGESEATVRMAVRIRLSDVGTAITIVADSQAGTTGEWHRIKASGNHRILRKTYNFLEQDFLQQDFFEQEYYEEYVSVSYTDTDFTYSRKSRSQEKRKRRIPKRLKDIPD